ncbi:MAG TPA: nitronate monooxygenase [Chloroflexota bacterium]
MAGGPASCGTEREDRDVGRARLDQEFEELDVGEVVVDCLLVTHGQGIAPAVEARAPLIVLFWGDPVRFVDDAHRNGVRVFVQVGSVTEAEAAARAGVDAVIAQGIEAGGQAW